MKFGQWVEHVSKYNYWNFGRLGSVLWNAVRVTIGGSVVDRCEK